MIYKENNNKMLARRAQKSSLSNSERFENVKQKFMKGIKEYTILTISLFLIVFGYVAYLSKYQQINQVNSENNKVADIGDATLVNSDDISSKGKDNKKNNVISVEKTKDEVETSVVDENDINEDVSEQERKEEEKDKEITEAEKTIETNSKASIDEYFVSSRLERENMYSQNIETYQKILESSNCSADQKQEASKKINEINDMKNSIMIAENLIKTKGFEDCIIFINKDSTSIIVKKEELSKEDIAKIQNIASRELSKKIDNIHISNKF